MTRSEVLMAISHLARVDADAAWERGDTDEAERLFGLKLEAEDMAGPEADKAYESLFCWLRSECAAPRVDSTWARIGV